MHGLGIYFWLMLGALAAPRWFQISCLKGQETIQLRSKSAEKAGWLGCGLCHAACCHYFKTTHLIFDFFPVFQVRRPRCSCTAPWCPCLRQTPSHLILFFSIFLVRSPCSSCAASWFPCLHQSCSAMLNVPICNCRSRCAQVWSPELLLSTCALRAGKLT